MYVSDVHSDEPTMEVCEISISSRYGSIERHEVAHAELVEGEPKATNAGESLDIRASHRAAPLCLMEGDPTVDQADLPDGLVIFGDSADYDGGEML